MLCASAISVATCTVFSDIYNSVNFQQAHAKWEAGPLTPAVSVGVATRVNGLSAHGFVIFTVESWEIERNGINAKLQANQLMKRKKGRKYYNSIR